MGINDLILLSASDIGAARNMAILAEEARIRNLPIMIAGSQISAPIFFQAIEMPDIRNQKDAVLYLESKKPGIVICGTTRYQSLDRLLIMAAKQLKIRSMVILDEWFNYAFRFGKENGGFGYLPDIICCQDQRAKREAIAEGIPASVLFVTGSIYLTNLMHKAKDFLKSPPPMPDFLNDPAVPVVTFLSETHGADYGVAMGEEGSLGKFIGYSQYSVRNDISSILNKISKPCIVVEKLHPSDENTYTPLGSGIVNWVISRQAQLWPLLWHSDLVIGMRSMALLEAAILGCSAVSYQPGIIGPELCTAARFDLIEGIYDKEGLVDWIRGNMGKKSNREHVSVRKFDFTRDDVLNNIMDLIAQR